MDSKCYFKNGDESFTLIELLVVIAIVGLLASIVLVSMGGLQSKANISKVLEFSQSVDHSLGAYAVGWWSFDENFGSIARDNSGYGNNGTINGPVNYTSDTPHLAAGSGAGKYALVFDGVSNYVSVPDSAVLEPTNEITISVWVYPTSYKGTFAIVATKNPVGNDGYIFALVDSNSVYLSIPGVANSGTDSNTISLNRWWHVAATWSNVSGKMRIYINGELKKEASANGSIGANNSVFSIGSYFPTSASRFFTGTIDEVRVYETVLTIGQIQKYYTEGLPMHKNLAIK